MGVFSNFCFCKWGLGVESEEGQEGDNFPLIFCRSFFLCVCVGGVSTSE